ncbi:hypothetical protein M3Y95_00848800 [Aphelenchoides besseyi]|nr:hypothetical protein M3Y95_00848800 [Aphelenchoides besseyi]
MRFLVFLVVLFLSFSVYEAQDPIIIELLIGMYVDLAPGTPKQDVSVGAINMFIGEMLFVDQNCGKHLTDCPRYCQDPAFFRAYCPLGCDPNLNSIDRRLYCGSYKTTSYKSNESSTFEIVQPFKKWSYQTAHYRSFEGIWISDVIQSLYDNKTFGSFRFVDLFYYDIRFGAMNVVLGIAPSKNGLAYQLYEQQKIDRPVLTIIPNDGLGGWLIYGEKANKSYCHEDQWTAHATIHPNHWLLKAESIQIGDQVYSNQIITFGFDYGIQIPAYQLSSLLKRRILFQPSEVLLTAPCNSTKLDLTIRIGNRTIFIPSNKTINQFVYDYKSGLCTTHISSIPTASYTNTTTWIFGSLITYCLFFDYEHMNVELGTRVD